jgi:hypothetical protein
MPGSIKVEQSLTGGNSPGIYIFCVEITQTLIAL